MDLAGPTAKTGTGVLIYERGYPLKTRWATVLPGTVALRLRQVRPTQALRWFDRTIYQVTTL